MNRSDANENPPNSIVPGPPEAAADPHIQIKFTIVFGILALIPFVLFYFYGLDKKPTDASLPSEPPRATFADITSRAGIQFIHENGAEGEKLLPETMGGGCAFFDFENDNDQDVLFVNSTRWPWSTNQSSPPTLAFYVNDGRGNFTDLTKTAGLDFSIYGMGVAAGDYDNDGYVDLFLTALGGNRLLKNLGGQKFMDVTAGAGLANTNQWSTSACFFDLENDGDLDLFVCNYVQWSREIDLQMDYRLPGIGRAYGPPMNFAGTFPLLYRNEGKGKFTDISASAGIQIKNKATGLPMAKSLGVAPVDLDDDGWMDLVVANDTVQNFVFRNNRDGTFKEIGGQTGVAFDPFGSTRGAMGIDIARLHSDNTLAISIGNFANEMTAFYLSSRDPLVFTDEALNAGIGAATRSLLTFGIFFFDYDLDGALDLLSANGHIEPQIQKVHPNQTYQQPIQLFWNSGKPPREGGFIQVTPPFAGPDLFSPIVGRGCAYADIDEDGDLDVLVTQVGGLPRLLRNDQNLKHNWVRVKLVGRKSNPDAIGAWVKIKVGDQVISRQVMPTRGYLSQSELPVTFGLGKRDKIDDVQVIWPGGYRQTGIKIYINGLVRVEQQ